MLKCTRDCGFLVVEEDYFERKRRFNPSVCPNCHAGVVLVVLDDGVTVDKTKKLNREMGSKTQGRVEQVGV